MFLTSCLITLVYSFFAGLIYIPPIYLMIKNLPYFLDFLYHWNFYLFFCMFFLQIFAFWFPLFNFVLLLLLGGYALWRSTLVRRASFFPWCVYALFCTLFCLAAAPLPSLPLPNCDDVLPFGYLVVVVFLDPPIVIAFWTVGLF